MGGLSGVRGSLDSGIVVGELGGDGGQRTLAGRGGGGCSCTYSYGSPTGAPPCQTTELNVAAQWLFDEGSGNIVDEVGGVSLAASGIPTYSETASGDFSCLSPGISYNDFIEHRKLTATASLDIGTSDFVIEEVFKYAGGAYDFARYLWSLMGQASATAIGCVGFRSSSTGFRCIFVADDTTTVDTTFTISATAYDDATTFHKARLKGDRNGNWEFLLDGVSGGTAAMSAADGKAQTNAGIRLPGQFNGGGNSLNGTVLEYRLTVGNNTNNSGGPGNG